MITSKQVRKAAARWQLYLLLAIPLAYIIIFHYVPIGGLQMAMKAFDLRYGIARSPWVGFRYFEKFLDSFQFSRILSNTLTLSFYSLFAGFPLPILLALLLNAAPHQTYKKLIQTVTYIPHFISTVVMVGILMQLHPGRKRRVARAVVVHADDAADFVQLRVRAYAGQKRARALRAQKVVPPNAVAHVVKPRRRGQNLVVRIVLRYNRPPQLQRNARHALPMMKLVARLLPRMAPLPQKLALRDFVNPLKVHARFLPFLRICSPPQRTAHSP